jgi:hypothetical protein
VPRPSDPSATINVRSNYTGRLARRERLSNRSIEKRRTSRPDSSSLYCIPLPEIIGFSSRLLFGFLAHCQSARITRPDAPRTAFSIAVRQPFDCLWCAPILPLAMRGVISPGNVIDAVIASTAIPRGLHSGAARRALFGGRSGGCVYFHRAYGGLGGNPSVCCDIWLCLCAKRRVAVRFRARDGWHYTARCGPAAPGF